MEHNADDFIEEFFRQGWDTYALVLLESVKVKDSNETVDRLDRLTMHFSKGNNALLNRGQGLLADWLKNNATQSEESTARRFRLRRAMILKKLKQYEAAIEEIRTLLEHDKNSAALHCLLGNLHANDGSHTDAVQCFQAAIKLADNWWEPKLELLERFFYMGLKDDDYWGKVEEKAKNWIIQSGDSMSIRERLILLAYGLVAKVLRSGQIPETSDYLSNSREALKIKIPSKQREYWNVNDVFVRVAKKRFSSDDEKSKVVLEELRGLLQAVQKELDPEHKWEEE
jgi:tetratricopeptide (TPR) repeat protein